MCWEQDVNVIVMLTRLTENNKLKCYKYWPGEGKEKKFGLFSVLLASKEKEHGLVTRFITLKKIIDEKTQESESRKICHFQYKEWPDHGLPSSAATFRHLLHLVDAMHDRRGPILVHCSAGIGRTGTFCAVHTITQYLSHHMHEHRNDVPDPEFNVFETILKLRMNRVGMVQTKDQFEFCYRAILEEYLDSEKRHKERKEQEKEEAKK
jgi:protein tyrosine phosphatase